MGELELPFATRLWFAWVAFFRVLLDGAFAARAWAAREALPAGPETEGDDERAPRAAEAPGLSEPEVKARVAEAVKAREAELEGSRAKALAAAREEGALLLLGLLQEGRLVDFLQQDVTTFEDADVGAAARVVHDGCKRVLGRHLELAPVRTETEGKRVTVSEEEAHGAVKLTGNLRGEAPFEGTLRHKGWRATKLTLPVPTRGHDAALVCPAEVEL